MIDVVKRNFIFDVKKNNGFYEKLLRLKYIVVLKYTSNIYVCTHVYVLLCPVWLSRFW